MFPEPGKNDVLSCHALTPDFLVLGTDMGGVSYFFLEDWVTVQEFKHGVGIKEIHPEPNGTKVILVDVKGQGHVYNPVNDEIALIREFPDKVSEKEAKGGCNEENREVICGVLRNTIKTFRCPPKNVARCNMEHGFHHKLRGCLLCSFRYCTEFTIPSFVRFRHVLFWEFSALLGQ